MLIIKYPFKKTPAGTALCVWLFLLMLPVSGSTQNLIMNNGFEDENTCTELKKNCAPEAWMSNSFMGNYYFIDPRFSLEGDKFIGLMYASSSKMEHRHFIRSRLLCGLRKGAKYRLDLHIRSLQDAFDSVGVFFAAKDPLYIKTGIKGYKTEMLIKDGLEKGDTRRGDWMKASFEYTATGDEDYIVFADFKKTAHQLNGKTDYYFIDDVSLVPLNKSEKLCPEANSVRYDAYTFNERHSLLEKKLNLQIGNPPPIRVLPKTLRQRVDTLTIPEVLFATNSYILNRRAQLMLDSFTSNAHPYVIDSIVIEGHTDNRGSAWLNEVLSENRAYAVFNYLHPHFGCPMIIRFWASQKPVADNRSPEGRQRNRRVEIYMYVRE